MADLPIQLRRALADRYTIERELGRGGMATVHLAHDLRHKRPVALKVLHPDLAQTLGPERFQREIETAARLQHPHILTVLDSGETAGQLWFTMPYVEGESLRDRLRRERQLSVDDAVRITREAAQALEYAHGHGVIHRDIKPENLLLTTDGNTLVADFGIARGLAGDDERLTSTGVVIGTPAYMSPEQAAGERQVDARSDVYSLGCVLYEMLAGEPPYTGPTAQAMLVKRLTDPVPSVRRLRPAVPLQVEAAIMRALEPTPADRFATAAALAEALTAGATSAAGAGRPWSNRVYAYAAAALLAGALSVGYVVSHRRSAAGDTERIPQGATVPSGASGGVTKSVAVLPLVNAGGDTAAEYFSDGLTDELTSALGKVPGLRVAARSSAFAFKGKPVDVQEVGTKLHVASVLEGNVRRAGRRLRLTAQLVNAADGLTLWTETYERDMTDVFAVQADIAGAIAGALRLTLGAELPAQLASRAPANLEAYELFLKARFHFNRQTEADLRTSISLYQEALAKDSTYALAWAGIADAWIWLADDYLPPRDAYPKAKAAALRALALDSTLAEAHASLGHVLRFYDWDYAAGERELQRAIALNPNAATGYLYWGFVLLSNPARLDSALVVMRRAELLDPLNPNTSANVAWVLLLMGRYDEAIGECRKALELDPQSPFVLGWMGEALLLAGRPEEALRALRRAQNPIARIRATMARALVALGRDNEARALLRELEREAQRHYVRPEAIAQVYVALGERDAAFRWLEKAYQARSANVSMLKVERHWDPIRADPRFTALMKKAGIP